MEQSLSPKSQKSFWQQPWRLRQSVAVVLGVSFPLLAVQLLSDGSPAVAPTYPFNRIIAIIFVLFFVAIGFLFSKRSIVRWLAGLHLPLACGIVMIGLLVIATCLPSIILELPFPRLLLRKIRITNLQHCWYFAGCIIILIVSLSTAIGKKIRHFSFRKTGFLLVHGGILLVLAAASFGTSEVVDMQVRLRINGSPKNSFEQHGEKINLPAKISFSSFELESYPPALALITRANNGGEKIAKGSGLCKKDAVYKWEEISVKILDFIPSAIHEMLSNNWRQTQVKGASPAALVRATGPNGKFLAQGWISCGGPFSNSEELPLSIGRVLVMLSPSPKKFQAELNILMNNGQPRREFLTVNHPLKIGDYNIYLMDYDVPMGAATRTAGFTISKDPLLRYVYSGFLMIMSGSFWMLWFSPWAGGKK